jgi:ATP-dependent Clp protease ATP-binding subunit ClpA
MKAPCWRSIQDEKQSTAMLIAVAHGLIGLGRHQVDASGLLTFALTRVDIRHSLQMNLGADKLHEATH